MNRFAVTLSVGMNHEPADLLNQSYVRWCVEMGVMPILIPSAIVDPVAYAIAMGANGLLLTGGNDLGDPVAAGRDRTEGLLLQYALDQSWAVFGICRGLQFINHFMGGQIGREVHTTVPGTRDHVGHPHAIQLEPGAVQESIGGTGWTVNSYHRHGVTRSILAPELCAFALSEDGLVEGLWHPHRRIMAVQWHRERPGSTPRCDALLVENFLGNAFWRRAET